MKNTKNTLKSIVTMVLAVAILVTNVTFNGTTTACAGSIENFADLENTTVTMKIGDTKKINYVTHPYGCTVYSTKDYDWISSDKSVVSLVCEYGQSLDEIRIDVYSFTIKAEKAGTAVITGTGKYDDDTKSFTVIVEGQKMTAKQKKCRHTWKTTKKATCIRSGMKTCKKCKLQKVVAKKAHEFETKTERQVTYPEYIAYLCMACENKDPEIRKEHNSKTLSCDCPEQCHEKFSSKDYGSPEAAEDAHWEHRAKAHGYSTMGNAGQAMSGGDTDVIMTNQYWFTVDYDYSSPQYKYSTVTRCKICQCTPEVIEKYYE